MSTDVASIMLPVSRGIMDRERDIDTTAGPLANVAVGGQAAAAAAAAAAVRGMKRGDPEPDAQTAAALSDLAGAECKRPRIDGTGSVVGEIGQVRKRVLLTSNCQIWYHAQVIVGSAVAKAQERSNPSFPFLLCLLHKIFCSKPSAGVMIIF